MSRDRPTDDAAAAHAALRRWSIAWRSAEIAFIATWMVLQERSLLPRWAGPAENDRGEALLIAAVIAFVAYLIVLAPLTILTARLSARIMRQIAGPAVRHSLRGLAVRPVLALGVFLAVAASCDWLGWWGIPATVVVLGSLSWWLARWKNAARPNRGMLLPRERFAPRLARLQAAAAALGREDMPIDVVDSAYAQPLAGCASAFGKGEQILISVRLFLLLDDRELGAVLAHELGHSRLGHLSRLRIVNAVTLILRMTALGVVWMWSVDHGPAWAGQTTLYLPRTTLTLCLSGLLLAPAVAAISRRQERRANRWALEASGDTQAFISAMTKLAEHIGATDRPAWWQRLTASHPSLDEVVAQARQFADERGIALDETGGERAGQSDGRQR